MQQIAISVEEVPGEGESIKQALLAKGSAMVMEPDHEHMLRVKALAEALERVTQEGISLGLLMKFRS